MPKKFELTTPVWQSPTDRLEAGTVVSFENDEPTGIFIDRVKELVETDKVVEVASPNVEKTEAQLAKEAKAAEKAKAKNAEVDEKTPPPPPAS